MTISIFDFDHYADFLEAWLKAQPKGGHGMRRKMAEAIGRQSVFISQVLHRDADLTLTQAQNLAGWLPLTPPETHQLMLLVQQARADSENLKAYFGGQIETARKQHLDLKNRLKGTVEEIPEAERARYYSSWAYGAIRCLTSIPRFQSARAMAERLGLPLETVNTVLEFLRNLGLIKVSGDRYQVTSKDVYLGNDSAMIGRHHVNWRLRALQSIEREKPDELHYSTAIVISQKDAEKIKRQLMQAIEANRLIVRDSGSEELYCVCVDFFRA